MSELRHHVTGATRSRDADGVRYDLIPPECLRRVAERYALGAATHEPNGWKRGLPLGDTYNHLLRHLEMWREATEAGRADDDDHLAAAAWGCLALMYFEERYQREPGAFLDPAPATWSAWFTDPDAPRPPIIGMQRREGWWDRLLDWWFS